MKKCQDWPIAVCTWSLALQDVQDMARAIKNLDIDHVHLALAPLLADGGERYKQIVTAQGWTVTCTMMSFEEEDYSTMDTIKVTGGISPDDKWKKNCDLVKRAIAETVALGASYLSFHFGFIDRPGTPSWNKLMERTGLLAEEAASNGVVLLMETGQETAVELEQFLRQLNHSGVAVNFDPANMILYDEGDPVEAVKVLASRIRHVHIKDAIRTSKPGKWGNEVPWGNGQVDQEGFLRALDEIGYRGALAIEREAGDQREQDIRTAIDRLAAFTG